MRGDVLQENTKAPTRTSQPAPRIVRPANRTPTTVCPTGYSRRRGRDTQQRGSVSAARALETGTRGLPLDDPQLEPGDETTHVPPALSVRDPELIGAGANNRALSKAFNLEVSGVDVATKAILRLAPTPCRRAPTPARLDIWVTSATPSTRKIPAPIHRTRHPRRRAQQPCAREHDPEFRHSTFSRSRAARSVSRSPEISREKTGTDHQ